MEESFLFLLLSYALAPTLSQRERAFTFTYKILAHWVCSVTLTIRSESRINLAYSSLQIT